MNAPIASFDVRFPEHLAQDRIASWLILIQQHATLAALDAHTFRASCTNDRAADALGCLLFHTSMTRHMRVVAVSGIAVAKASAYRFISTRAERDR
jgi:hypothetical protein